MQWQDHEQRRFIRTEFPYTIILTLSDDEEISTYTENISATGVKVTIRKELPPQTRLSMQIYLSQEPILCKGKIIWTKGRQSECLEDTVVYDAGIEFFNIKEKDTFSINQCAEKSLRKDQDSKGGNQE